MAKKFYLNDAAASYSPAAAKGAWDDTTNQPNIGQLGTFPSGDPSGSDARAETSTTNNWDVLLNTFVSDPLWGAVSFKTSDKIRGVIGFQESNAAANMMTHLHIWVTVGDSDTVRGTLLNDSIGSEEWPTTAAGVDTGLLSVANNVNAQAGDHIVIEIGYQAQNTSASSFTGTDYYGNNDPTQSDLIDGDTNVGVNFSWIEFSTVFPPEVVLLGSTHNTNSGSHTVSAIPQPNDLIVIVTEASGNTADTAPTDNNTHGGTYTQIANPVKNSSADKLAVYVRTEFIQYKTATTFTHNPGTSTGGGLSVYAIRGMAKVGAAAIRQFAVQSNQASGTPAPTFGVAALTANPILSAVFNQTNPAGITPKSGYTRGVNTGYATPTSGLAVMTTPNGETGTAITWGSSSASAFCSLAIEFDSSVTLLENQQDTFPGSSLSSSLWYDNTQSGATQTVSGNAVHLTAPASTPNALAEVETQQRYNFVGSHAFVKMVVTQVADVNAEAGMTVYHDEYGNQMQLIVTNGNLVAGYLIAGVTTTVASIAYNASTMAWIRIRESGGTIFFDYSSDGNSWTNLGSVATNVMVWGVDLVRSSVLAYDGDSNASAEVGVFSNYNISQSKTKTFTADGIVKGTNTKTFTVDGIIQGKNTNTITFTVDGVVNDNTGTPSTGDIIKELMAIAPIGTLKNNAAYVAPSGSNAGYTRMTQAVNSQTGELEYTKTLPSAFIIEADLWAGGGNGADAAYVYWGCTATATDEDQSWGGYVVALDEYSGDDFPIQLQYGGTRLASSAYPYPIANSTIRKLKVVVDGTRIRVYVNKVLLIDYTDTTRTLGTLIGVGGRTGGFNEEHRCYRLYVYSIASPYHPTISTGALSGLKYRSIDVMKLTKDFTINDQLSRTQKQAVISTLFLNFNLTHIAISVPLDTDADYIPSGIVPVPGTVVSEVQEWCDVIHGAGLGVIFRGDYNELERDNTTANWNFILAVGVNRFPRGSAASAATDGRTTWLGKLYQLIVNNPTWYQDGDIFAPMPERTENNTEFVSISSITRVGTTATVTTSGNHNVGNGQPVTIQGSNQSDYNGSFIATVLNSTQFTIQVANNPTTPATGTMNILFGVSVFDDGNSWIGNDGSGVNANYAQFFEDLITIANNAFSLIGKNVKTGFSSNNYSEIQSGWIQTGLFTAQGRIAVDHYGSDHSMSEMYNNLVGIALSIGQVIDHEEWSDYWNGALDDQTRQDYLVHMYDTFAQMLSEGIYEMLNYWGGWSVGIGEGILTDTSGGQLTSFDITPWGQVLSAYFANPSPPVVLGTHGIPYGYYLNGVLLKTPVGFERQYVYAKNDYITLTGKTVRDVSTIKEKYILTFENLTTTQADAIEAIIRLEKPVSLTINGKDIVNINTTVWPFSASIVYDKPGQDYRSKVTLELMEVGG